MTFDASSGRVWIAVDLALDSESDREKHTDVVEQGTWLFWAAAKAIRDLDEKSEGGAILKISYYGTDANGAAVREDG